MSTANFDFVAPFYDSLSRLVFGRAMKRAQTAYLQCIKPNADVLILGGGTGWLVRDLAAINPTCKVWYVEASARMIELAMRKTKTLQNEIIFIHGTEDAIPEGVVFDAVITHFFLDLFSPAKGGMLIEKIRRFLQPGAIWLAADFVNTTWWHGAMLLLMYRFFKIVSDVRIDRLPNWETLMKQAGFEEIKSQTYFGSFIKSALFAGENEFD